MEIVKLRDQEHMAGEAAAWFHSKWGIPKEAYEESMAECLLNKGAVPQWYLVMENDVIIGGAGIIENDFHDRKDLSPNLCVPRTWHRRLASLFYLRGHEGARDPDALSDYRPYLVL